MSVFELVRERASLEEVVGARIGEKSRCVAPDHPDTNPSMHNFGDHVHCFSCGYWGDVVDAWAATRGFDGPMEAALDLARKYGVELPERSPEAQKKAQERRDKEDLYLRQAEACHKALSRHENVAYYWEQRGFDEEQRERFLLGANRDGTVAVMPFWHRGRAQGLIRRNLRGDPKYLYPKAQDFPGGYRPLFVPGPVRTEAFLVEGVVDALALASLGESAIATGGARIGEKQLQELRSVPGPLHILPDADKEGDEAARRWARDLYPKALVCPAEYGKEGPRTRKDFAESFAAEGEAAKERLEDLKGRAADGLDLALSHVPDDPSNRRRLKYVRENIVPLILRRLETKGPVALTEPVKDSGVMVALDDVHEATKLRLSVLKAGVEEEAQRRLVGIVDAVEADEEVEAAAGVVPEEAYAPLLEPGVLERYVRDCARMHGVVGDTDALKLITLTAVGAQLDLLPNGKPLGPSTMLIAESGRGKNYLTDAVVGLLPGEWYIAFESANAASMYYQVERHPDFLKHRFVYPNEAEATDMLVEFLRPMLSGGKAIRLTVNKNDRGRNEGQELEVRGPVTAIIPTVRNKLDEQLQTRLLVAELEDYAGRVKTHARAFGKLLLPSYAAKDNSEDIRAWRAALGSLTALRRVVFPLDHEGFALNNDEVSHGARLWASLLGMMCAHGWLEQRNRLLAELPSGEKTVVIAPDDYEAAYRVFEATSLRTVANLSDTHRKILNAVHDLQIGDPDADGFSQRVIAEAAGIGQGTVSKQKTFLVTSAKLLRETDHGLALVNGAEPGWWETGTAMRGFPTPEWVKARWNERPDPWSRGNQRNTEYRQPQSKERAVGTYTENDRRDDRDHYSRTILEDVIVKAGPPEPKAGDNDEHISHITAIPKFTGGEDEHHPSGRGDWEEV